MPTGSFYYPYIPTGITDPNDGPWNLACNLVVSGGTGGNLVGVRFWKVAADTGTHTVTVWNTSGSTLLRTETFTGETAQDWQTYMLATPVPLPAGTYRVAISRSTAHYAQRASVSSITTGAYQLSGGGYGVAGSGTGFPSSSFPTVNFAIDPIVDNLPQTDVRATEAFVETWVPAKATGQYLATEVMLETWVPTQPRGAFRTSEAFVEVWVPVGK